MKIVSYPQYCRYISCLRLMTLGVPMSYKVYIARGGILLIVVVYDGGSFKLSSIFPIPLP